jgi:hypothetical protein
MTYKGVYQEDRSNGYCCEFVTASFDCNLRLLLGVVD